MFKKLINYMRNIFTNEIITIKPCNKWGDLGKWNDFKNIGTTIKNNKLIK